MKKVGLFCLINFFISISACDLKNLNPEQLSDFVKNNSINATFSNPRGIVVDSNSNVFIADSNNYIIKKLNPDGTLLTFSGSGKKGNKDGASNIAEFSLINGLAIDHDKNLLVMDIGNKKIRKITPDGFVSSLDIDVVNESHKQIVTDEKGNIFITDLSSSLIKISPNGVLSNLVVNGKINGFDKTGNSPVHIGSFIVNKEGNVFITDISDYIGLSPGESPPLNAEEKIIEIFSDGKVIPFKTYKNEFIILLSTDNQGNFYTINKDKKVIEKLGPEGNLIKNVPFKIDLYNRLIGYYRALDTNKKTLYSSDPLENKVYKVYLKDL